MSPPSLSLFLMTFLLLNGHDFCVPPSMNFLSLYTINDNSNSLLTKTTPLSQSVQPTYCHLRIKLWIKCVRKVPDIKAIYAFMVRCVLFSNSQFLNSFVEVRYKNSISIYYQIQPQMLFLGILKYIHNAWLDSWIITKMQILMETNSAIPMHCPISL